ncbi:MAG TPA: tyrosine-type recombinase/integrase, partial [Candidatus Xenobia bacterium]
MNLALWQTQFRTWLASRHYSPRTVESYGRELEPFFAWLDAAQVDNVSDIRNEHLEGYRGFLYEAWWRGRRLSVATQSYRLSALKCFFGFLSHEHFLPRNLGAEIDLPRAARPLPRALLSERETERLLDSQAVGTTCGLRNRAILELFYGTAIRNSELRDLTTDQVDLERRELRFVGKGKKGRVLPLGEAAAHWLGAWLWTGRPRLVRDDTRLVFVSVTGRPLHRGPLADMVRQAGRAAGLKKPVTPHLLRAACVTHMLRRGASLRHLQEFLGHACLGTIRDASAAVSDRRPGISAILAMRGGKTRCEWATGEHTVGQHWRRRRWH